MVVEGGAASPGPREKLEAQIKSADMVSGLDYIPGD